jgi:hypothetical protein
VDAARNAKPVGSDVCLDAVRRLRQLLSAYDEPPLKEAVQGERGAAAWGGAWLRANLDGALSGSIWRGRCEPRKLCAREINVVVADISVEVAVARNLSGCSGRWDAHVAQPRAVVPGVRASP